MTARRRDIAARPSRDPADPDGYLAALRSEASLDAIADSYIAEALQTYNAGCFKSAAVMVGAAAERLTISLRDAVLARFATLSKTPAQTLSDWRVKTIRDGLTDLFDTAAKAS